MNAATIQTETKRNATQLALVKPNRRPMPVMRVATYEDVAWDPVVLPCYLRPLEDIGGVQVEGQNVRAGEEFCIVRPGYERWPLGRVSDHYRIASHNDTAEQVKNFCAHAVTPRSRLIAGHGYAVVHGYDVRHLKAAEVEGAPVTSRLMIVSDHSGSGAIVASIVLYVGSDAIGSMSSTRGLHVSSHPEGWQQRVDGLIEMSLLVQDALLDLLRAAAARKLTDEDRAFFKKRGMRISKDDETALDACRSWLRGRSKKSITYGVWARRLDDAAIRSLVVLLGRDKYGKALDDAMNSEDPTYAIAR